MRATTEKPHVMAATSECSITFWAAECDIIADKIWALQTGAAGGGLTQAQRARAINDLLEAEADFKRMMSEAARSEVASGLSFCNA